MRHGSRLRLLVLVLVTGAGDGGPSASEELANSRTPNRTVQLTVTGTITFLPGTGSRALQHCTGPGQEHRTARGETLAWISSPSLLLSTFVRSRKPPHNTEGVGLLLQSANVSRSEPAVRVFMQTDRRRRLLLPR